MKDVGIFSDSAAMNSTSNEKYEDEQRNVWIVSGWTMIHVNNVGSITPTKFSKC